MPACDLDESLEDSELRACIMQYDELTAEGAAGELDNVTAQDLDELFTYLYTLEQAQWGNTNNVLVLSVIERLDLYFPLLRYQLGMLPVEYTE